MHAMATGGIDGTEELLTIEEAARRLAVGQTTIKVLVRTGALQSVKVGRLRRIPAESVREYARQLAGR